MTIALESASPASPGTRIVNAMRLQFVNPQTFVWVPLIVVAGVWALTLLIYWILSAAGVGGPMYGGGAQAPLWYFAVVGSQALTRTFYFSQAMTLTRREFFFGAVIAAAASGAGVALLFVALGLVEQATGGYGINGYFAYIPWVWDAGPAAAGLTFFVLSMLAFTLGFWFTIVYAKFGTLVLTLIVFGIGLGLVAAAAVISLTRTWLEVWSWFAEVGVLELTLWTGVVCVLFAFGSYLTLRRMTT